MNRKSVILGAGVTGMAVAYKLAEGGHDVFVIEQEPQVGGLAGCVVRNDMVFDFGPHAFLLNDDMKKELFQIVSEEEFNIFEKNVKIKFGEKYYHYPLDAIDILLKSSPLMALSCLFDYIIAKIRMKIVSPIDASAESWIINRFGKSLYRIYFEKYTEKVWGIHPRIIAPSFTEERIPLLKLRATVMTTARKTVGRLLKKERTAEPSYLAQLYYPKKGLTFFFEQLANRIKNTGGMIYLNSSIIDLHHSGSSVDTVRFKNGDDVKTVESDFVVSTIPVTSLIERMHPKFDQSVLTAANSLKFRALIFVNLVIDKEEVFDVQWIYFRNKIFNRVSEINKFSRRLIPEGLTGLCAEITCDIGDDIWNADERQLCQRVIRELEEEGFFHRADVKDFFVTRKEHGYPVADLNYQANLKTLKDALGDIENLFVTGRQGLFRYLQMDHCMKMGFELAHQILSQDVMKRKNSLMHVE